MLKEYRAVPCELLFPGVPVVPRTVLGTYRVFIPLPVVATPSLLAVAGA